MNITLEDFMARVNRAIDKQLVELAKNPESRPCFRLGAIDEDFPARPLLDMNDSLENVALLREIMTYEYIIEVLNAKLLPLSKEVLYECVSAMRKVHDISYVDLYNYHRLARMYYEQEGLARKAGAHERAEVLYSVCEDIRYGYLFNFDTCIRHIKKYPERLKAFVLYASFLGCKKLADSSAFARSRYVMLQKTLRLGIKLFAEDEACDKSLRACIYYFKSCYCDLMDCPDEAEKARQMAISLGGDIDYEYVCWDFIEKLPHLYESEREMIYTVYAYIDVFERMDEKPLSTWFESDDTKEELEKCAHEVTSHNVADVSAAKTFGGFYLLAEEGDLDAMSEVARRYREGDGVAVCAAAADAWDEKVRDLLNVTFAD